MLKKPTHILSLPDLIAKKRDSLELSKDEMESFVTSVCSADTSSAQTGAMLMAMYLRGLSVAETECLTRAMMYSGEVLEWPDQWKHLVVDKHSCGGVGDKISLPLAPALAACGLKVPMISGRGLGYTGGTLDKLESIPGMRIMLTKQEIQKQLDQVGCCIVGQTPSLVPADKILYSIRDTTGTVNNTSLITASIMSKKAAENISALVMEITVGSGSPFKQELEARSFANMLIRLGTAMGITTTGMMFHMDAPVGFMIGNSLEVLESVQCLQGKGPQDLTDCVAEMGGQLLADTGLAGSLAEGQNIIKRSLQDGSAARKFIEMLVWQGVSREIAEGLFNNDSVDILPKSKLVTDVLAPCTGYIDGIDALCCGKLAHRLGAGRNVPGQDINYGVGVELTQCVGNFVNKGDVWARIHHDSPLLPDEEDLMTEAITFASAQTPEHFKKRIFDTITMKSLEEEMVFLSQ